MREDKKKKDTTCTALDGETYLQKFLRRVLSSLDCDFNRPLNTSAAKSNGGKSLVSVHFTAFVMNSFPRPGKGEEVSTCCGDDEILMEIRHPMNAPVETSRILLLLLFFLPDDVILACKNCRHDFVFEKYRAPGMNLVVY